MDTARGLRVKGVDPGARHRLVSSDLYSLCNASPDELVYPTDYSHLAHYEIHEQGGLHAARYY